MKNTKHITYSTIFTIIINLALMLTFKSKLPSKVPIHWDMNGNLNGQISQTLFVYGTPFAMGIINLIASYNSRNKYFKSAKLYYIIPIICLLISILMLYLALK